MSEVLSQPSFHLFAVCAAILVIKMVLTGNATGLLRVVRGVYITPEDYAMTGKPAAAPDEQIERTRTTSRTSCPSSRRRFCSA